MPTNYRIDALLGETFSFKNGEFPLGTPVRVGYALPVARSADWPETTFQSLTTPSADAYETLVRDALALIEATCGIDFVETSASAARIQFSIASIAASGVAAPLVEVLYRNLVGAPLPAEALADLTARIDGGIYTQGGFYAAAAHELNTARFVGLIEQGIEYLA